MTSSPRITINRAPVLTLWAAVVAKRLGFAWDEALTLGRAVAGLNAYSKGKALGLFHPKPADVKEKRTALKHGQEIQVTYCIEQCRRLGHRTDCGRSQKGARSRRKASSATSRQSLARDTVQSCMP